MKGGHLHNFDLNVNGNNLERGNIIFDRLW